MPSISLPVAVLGAGALGAGAAVLASGAQAGAAKQAANTQMQMFDIAQANLAPYRNFGDSMLGPLGNLLTGSPSQVLGALQNLPGYQFDLTQGLKATQNSAAARGLGVSGAALKGAATYATGLADSTYGNQVNRLMGAAGLGENAAAGVGNAALQTGQGVGSAQLYGGSAAASGFYNGANALGGGLTGYSYLNNMYGSGGGYNAPFTDSTAIGANGIPADLNGFI